MKTIICTAALLAACSAATFAQSTPPPSETTPNRPLIDQQTKDNVKEKAGEVKQDVKEKTQDIRQEVKEKAGELKQDVNQVAGEAKEKIDEQYEVSRSYQERNQLTWFQKGSYMGGLSLGVGTGAGSGTYLALNPRIAYFVQPGLAVGLRLGFDRRLGTSYRANQTGAFLRYYPFRTRISGFGGFGYNFGRERSSNIAADEKARYNSVNLEIGTMLWIMPNLGVELSLENNYYDQSDPLAGRNKGGRFKFGVNYFLGRPNRQ